MDGPGAREERAIQPGQQRGRVSAGPQAVRVQLLHLPGEAKGGARRRGGGRGAGSAGARRSRADAQRSETTTWAVTVAEPRREHVSSPTGRTAPRASLMSAGAPGDDGSAGSVAAAKAPLCGGRWRGRLCVWGAGVLQSHQEQCRASCTVLSTTCSFHSNSQHSFLEI